MRLISCHIENFGKLNNKDISFDSPLGVNVLCENNGWGKSTLAAFIKVMFFGFDNEGRRSHVENERQRYKPWQGGVYGGRLTFEAEGKRYTISRIFGAKEKDDEFVIQDADTKLGSTNFSKKVGEELFHIDSASFARSIYISQNDCVTATTDKINAKLGNLSDNTDDLNNYETAVKKIADRLNALSGTRKTGELYKQKEELMKLKQEIKRAAALDASMEEILKLKNNLHASYENLKNEQKVLQERQKEISEYKDILVKKKEYENLCGAKAQKYALCEEKKALFPNGLPSSVETDKYINLEYHTSGLKKKLDFYKLNDEESGEFDLLDAGFSAAFPKNEEIEEAKEKVNVLQTLLQKLEKSALTEDEAVSLDALKAQFAENVPTKEELDALSKEWSIRSEKKNTLTSKKATYDMLKRTEAANRQAAWNAANEEKRADAKNRNTGSAQRNKRRIYTAFAVSLSAAVALAGILLCFMLPAAGIGILAADIIAAFGCVVMSTRKRKVKSSGAADRASDNATGRALDKSSGNASGEAADSVSDNATGRAADRASETDAWEYDNEYEAVRADDKAETESSFDLYAELKQEIENDEKLIKETESYAERFLAGYQVPYEENGVISELYQLKENARLYERLLEKSQNSDVERLKEQCRELRGEVEGFIQSYALGDAADAEYKERSAPVDAAGADYKERSAPVDAADADYAKRSTPVNAADTDYTEKTEDGDAADADYTDRTSYYVNRIYGIEASLNRYFALKNKKENYAAAYEEYKKNLDDITAFLKKVNIRMDGETDNGMYTEADSVINSKSSNEAVRELNTVINPRAAQPKDGSCEEFATELHDMLHFIKDAGRDYMNAKAEYETASELKDRFETENRDILDAVKNAGTFKDDDSLVAIEERLSQILVEIEKYHTNMALYERQLDELQEKRDEITDSENRLSELQEAYALNEKNFSILKNTQKYLEQAKISLTARYTEPIKAGFDKYFKIICGIESENYQLDANLGMSVIEQGMPRDTAFLSMGYQDMVGICMRMALVDAMYQDEKPFVIFDDPFVNLDADKTKGALRFLKEIAREYQVVYFTCNEGRR